MKQSGPKPPSYLRAWLTSQTNAMTLLGGGLAAVIASFPAGLAGFVGGLVVLGAAQVLTALVIPDLPSFRSKVDRQARRAAIEQRRNQLRAELYGIFGGEERVSGMGMWRKYETLIERAAVLYRIAGEAQSQLSYDDAERVDKASVDYLALWLAKQTIEERIRRGEEATLDRRLRETERALAEVSEDDPRYRHLKMARDDYAAIKLRHDKLAARRMSIEAALVSLPDQVEEIYQMVVASPYSNVLGSKLGESLSRLQLEEDIELELSENDLDSDYFKTGAAGAQALAARQAARGAQTQNRS
jgi:hypothetical protein